MTDWICKTCHTTHPDDFCFCPRSGEPRQDADEAFVPEQYRDRPEEWETLATTAGGLDPDALLALGLVRVDMVPDAPRSVLLPQFRAHALERRAADPIAMQLSQIPRAEDGTLLLMDITGPYMQRELPMVRFVVQYVAGDLPEIETVIRQVINEWHGLDRNLGLDGA